MSENKSYIPNRLKNASKEHPYVAGAVDIIDDRLNQNQQDVNAGFESAIAGLNDQNYFTVEATDEDTSIESIMSRAGVVPAKDTVYRVGFWDGEQYDESKYSEYAWNESGNTWKLLDVKEYTLATADDFIEPDAQKRAKVVTVGAAADVYGSYEENPEWVEVKTDSEGKILEGIRPDGTREFEADVKVKGSLLAESKVEFVGGTIENTENPEFIDVKTDNEDKILEGIKVNGTKVMNIPIVTPAAVIESNNSPEWLSVFTDKDGRIIEGIKADGERIAEGVSLSRMGASYLVVCGSGASPYQVDLCKKMKNAGYGCLCSTDVEANEFIDKFIGVDCTIKFFGTITCAHGIHKHPTHNLDGYGATLKMGNRLNQDYWGEIFCTEGLSNNASCAEVSHNYTFIKGFVLDGNCEGQEKTWDSSRNWYWYSRNTLYGVSIVAENYKVWDGDPTHAVVVESTDITLEDITVINSIRGLVVESGWRCRNINVGDSMNDHAIYVAGGSRAVVENAKLTGFHGQGSIAVSPQSWISSEEVHEVILRNIYVDTHDCSCLDIRGHFSEWGNNKALRSVLIDGLYCKLSGSGFYFANIGTSKNEEVPGTDLYPINITLRNLHIEGTFGRNVFYMSNVMCAIENSYFDINYTWPQRGMFITEAKDIIKNALSIRDVVINLSSTANDPYSIFEFAEGTHVLNGLGINALTILSLQNYYMFDTISADNTDVDINNARVTRLSASPLAMINPVKSSIITLNDYKEF